MATRMQQRRGTAEQWTLADPVLAEGEIGFESDTGNFKVGNGVDFWFDLPYFQNADTLAGSLDDYVPLTEKAAANGVATLDATGNVPATQLGNVDFTGYATETYADQAETDAKSYTDTLIGDGTVDGTTGNTVTDRIATAVSNLVDSAPSTLDTLNELSAALADDPNFATTITNELASKAPLASPAFTGTVDVSDATLRASFANGIEFYGLSQGINAVTQTIYPGGNSSNPSFLFLPHATGTVALTSDLDAKAPLTQPINAKTGAYTLVAEDKGDLITASGTFTITVPGNVFVAGDRVDFVNIGTGTITFSGSSLTLNAADAKFTVNKQWAGATVFFTSATTAVLIGNLA